MLTWLFSGLPSASLSMQSVAADDRHQDGCADPRLRAFFCEKKEERAPCLSAPGLGNREENMDPG
jgi:hypothetical protein